jgi:hypothetical protein
MKTIFWSVFLWLATVFPATAKHYLGCGAEVVRPQVAGIENLKQQSDNYLGNVCYFQSEVPPRKDRWFPALPTIQWHQSYPSRLSHSQADARFSEVNINWPILTLQRNPLYLYGEYQELQLVSAFRQATLWTATNQIFPQHQSVLINRDKLHWGLALKLRHAQSQVNTLNTGSLRMTQPLRILQQLPGRSELLSPANIQISYLGIGYQKEKHGWNIPWHFRLGQGDIRDDSGNFIHQLDNNTHFHYLSLTLGFGYRYRWGQQLYLESHYQLQMERFDFADVSAEDNYKLPDLSTTSHRLQASLEWRF